MANLASDATLPTSAQTGNIDLVTLNAIVSNVVTTVLRQVMVLGDPIQGLNKASVVPDEIQGWESGLVIKLSHSPQLSDMCDVLQMILTEIQQQNFYLGGMPVTTKLEG